MSLTDSELARQAADTAAQYMAAAVREIDAMWGPGFAQQNPTLVAAFMQTGAADYAATIQVRSLGQLCEALDGIASGLAG